jgi:hypothetical protein
MTIFLAAALVAGCGSGGVATSNDVTLQNATRTRRRRARGS